MTAALADGREAFERYAWEEAFASLTSADREEPLAPGDLQLLAKAAWWSGRVDDAVDALERAYSGHLEQGQTAMAAILALQLCELAYKRHSSAIASGWLARAQRLLEGEPESVGHAWLSFMRATQSFMANDFDAAMEYSDNALRLAQTHGSREVAALALNARGQILLRKGEWAEGLALIDEATTAVISGELEPKTACDVYCMTISACRDLADYRRASEWVNEAERWMQRRSLRGYQGICRVHRAELKRLRGSWSEAEREARVACQELEQFHLLGAAGFAHYEVGVVRLQMGDLAGAEEAFARAHAHGRDPQPGRSLLMLARGEVEAASRAIERSLSISPARSSSGAPSEDALHRAQLLPARVEIALAADDVATAGAATAELEAIAETFGSAVLRATAAAARGSVQLAEGHPDQAVVTLDRAWRLLRDVDLPYESARARVLLGRALSATGDEATARLELRAASETFQRLGAALAARQVRELLDADEHTADAARRRVSKCFMFTDIVTSTDLVGVIGDRAWEDLLAWHDRALRTELGRHGGEEVRHTGDGFFVSFDRAAEAVACAVSIQRRLAEHRREHGFAPSVRIGLHVAEATRQGSDYAGHGVHLAARIGAVATSEEIVASRATVEAARVLPYPTSNARAVSLKGIEGDVEVCTIDWR